MLIISHHTQEDINQSISEQLLNQAKASAAITQSAQEARPGGLNAASTTWQFSDSLARRAGRNPPADGHARRARRAHACKVENCPATPCSGMRHSVGDDAERRWFSRQVEILLEHLDSIWRETCDGDERRGIIPLLGGGGAGGGRGRGKGGENLATVEENSLSGLYMFLFVAERFSSRPLVSLRLSHAMRLSLLYF